MRVESISVLGFIEGKILAEDVLNDAGALLVTKNTQVNRYIKHRLLDMNISNVRVYAQDMERSFKDRYFDNVSELRNMLNDLATGKGLGMDKLRAMSETVYNEILLEPNITSNLLELMNADEYTYTHSLNVAFYAALAAKWLRYPEKDIKVIIQAGLLHDIGKIKLPSGLLNKKECLNPEEFDEIKRHTVYGYEMVCKIKGLHPEVKNAVLMHHEREDKSGYPLKAGSNDINVFSKIIAVADVFDAMTSDRVYKKGVSPFEAFTMFQTVGQVSFDVKIVNSFLRNIAACYTGMNVLTDSGFVGKVVYVPPHDISKPVIRVDSNYLDLSRDKSMKILKIL